MHLGEYYWKTYGETNDRAEGIRDGLLRLGHKPGENLVIFAETCADWMTTALACFSTTIPGISHFGTLMVKPVRRNSDIF